MVKSQYTDKKTGLTKGAWSEDEDNKLRDYVRANDHRNWRQLPKAAGLNRCGKSCRLRWENYLKPGVKRGNYTPEEEDLIIRLHLRYGNQWSKIASELKGGRTDNDIKNHSHTHKMRRKMAAMAMMYNQDDSRPLSSTEDNISHHHHQESLSSSPSSSITLDYTPQQITEPMEVHDHGQILVADAADDDSFNLPDLEDIINLPDLEDYEIT